MGQGGIEQLKHMFYRKKRCGRMVEGAMKIEALLGLPEGLEVVDSDVANQVITLTIISTQQHPSCPLCGRRASRVHSHYRRQLTDMSCARRRVRFILHVRKFFCDEKTCVRKIITLAACAFHSTVGTGHHAFFSSDGGYWPGDQWQARGSGRRIGLACQPHG
jgi:hypothetical protein